MSALDALLKRMLDQESNQANSRNRLQTMPQASYTTTPGAGAQRDADRQMADARSAWMSGDDQAFDGLRMDNVSVQYPYGRSSGGAGGGEGGRDSVFGPATGMIQAIAGPNGTTQYMDSTGQSVQPSDSWKIDDAGRLFDSLTMPGMAGTPAGLGGGGGAGGSGSAGGGGGGSFGGSLGQAVNSGYENIIKSGGNILTPLQQASTINREGSAIARGGNDAIQAAREDAARRGDATGASLGDVEGRIRSQSSANQANAATDREAALRREATGNLMGALGGGTNLLGAQATNSLAQQQLGLQNKQFGLSALGTLASLNK